MLKINKKGFTLVELIVVITILAILWTIWFISLQWYSSASRDSKRITDLWQVRTWIQLYQAKEWVVPEPDETKTIVWSWTTNLVIQWYAWTWTLRNIKVNTDAKDPLEDNYYTYSTNWAKTKFQLLALLENNNTAYNNILPTTYANYETREPYVIWDKLWILLDSTTNTPVQELWETDIDLNTNTTEYKAIFSKSDIQTLSWTPLYQEIVTKSNNEWVEENIVYSSCKEILDNWASTWDGTYTIDPENDWVWFEVYCDMTTDWGGWIDVHKTFLSVSNTILYRNKFFYSDNFDWLPVADNNGFYIEYEASSNTHALPLYMKNISSVIMSWSLQWEFWSNRCSSSSWVPLNWPWYNGWYNWYLASCKSGYNCIQWLPVDGRDASISANYSNNNLDSSTLLTWSASDYDGTNSTPSCWQSSNIDISRWAIWFSKLLIK